MAKSDPTLAGAGSFRGSYECFVAGKQGTLTSFPNAPIIVGSVRLVTVSSDDASLPALTITDDDGNTYTATGSPPPNEAQFTMTSPGSHAVGGNKVKIVWPNATQHATNPRLLVQDFNPSGS